MHERNREIFNFIVNNEQQNQFWGNDVRTLLCPDGQVDLLVTLYNQKAYLLCTEGDSKNQLKIFVELFSYLRYAEENHLIYVKNNVIPTNRMYNFYENHDEFNTSALNTDYDIGNGHLLHVAAGDIYSYDVRNPKGKILSEYVDVSFLYNEITHYLFGTIHAAYGLKTFIEHDYLSDQDYYSNYSLNISRRSMWIAIAVAVLTPVVTILLGNGIGRVRLVDEQYEGLKTLTTIFDTVEVVRHDTTYIHDTIYIPIHQSPKKKK